MAETPTPGQVAYEAYCARLSKHRSFHEAWTWLAWGFLADTERAAWEAASQAVLAAPQQAPVCAHCQRPYTWKCSCDGDEREEETRHA